MRIHPMRLVCFAVFLMSGFAALLYQVIWQRMLAIFSGTDVYSATIIVSAFMAGLGIGSLAGGHVADRVSARTSLVLFGLAELAVAAFGVLSARLYYDVLYSRIGHFNITPGPMAGILFLSLLWPTFFMGASLPLLARALTRQLDEAASTVGSLYGLNTLGAAMGAMVATWWLLPRIGLEGSLGVGATLNAACAVVVLPFAFRGIARPRPWTVAGSRPRPATPLTVLPEAGAGRFTFWMWAAIYGFSGLLALSLEIVWFRMLGVMMKSTAFTFGTLLALYLGGFGLGSVVGSALASRIRRPAVAFLMIQAAVGLCAGGLLSLLIAFVDDTRALTGYFAGSEAMSVQENVGSLRALVASFLSGASPPEYSPSNFIMLYVGVPAMLVVPATFLMGCSFPLLQRVVQTDLALLGRRVGTLLSANILGSMLGTVLTSWVLLDVLGTAGTLRLLAGMSGVFGLLAAGLVFSTHHLTLRGHRVPTLAAASGAVATLFVPVLVSMPSAGTFWARLHGTTVERIFFGEDGSGLSVIKTDLSGFQSKSVVFVNGVGQSTLPYGDIHTALGAVPAFLHPAPRDAAVIGLGSGDTVHAVAGRPDIERVTCVEIIRSQLDTLEQLTRRWPYGGLRSLLENPRIEHVVGDGRAHLMRSGRRYDIIEADALRPGSAYSGNLYSEEYFRLVRSRLKPKGLAATWAPTARVHNTFVRIFPYVMSIPGILIGSETPIELDRKAIASRLADHRVRHYYNTAGIDIERLLTDYLTAPAIYTPDFNRAALTDYNTDLFPKDEYDLALRR
jgi:predicted membrane-bound spermidine synthase